MGQNIKIDKEIETKNQLSFFVPTYGRTDSLRETITSIYDHWKEEYLVDVIISDNNEDDKALKVIRKFNEKSINYSPNKKNIGIDNNMLKFLKVCNSRYCWLLGDDDILDKNAYNLIYPFLNKDLDFIVLINNVHSKILPGVHNMATKELVGEAFLALWDKLPFGKIIVNVERMKKLNFEKYYNKYIGTSHAYGGVIWETAISINSSGKYAVVTENVVHELQVGKSWANSLIKIHLQEIPDFFKLLPKEFEDYKLKTFKIYKKLIFSPSFLFIYSNYMSENMSNRKIINKLMINFSFVERLKVKIFFFIYVICKKLIVNEKNIKIE